MIYIGMDVHQSSTTFCLFDPSMEKAGRYRTVTRPTTAEAVGEVLAPFERRCQVVFEVGTQAQWIAQIVRPPASTHRQTQTGPLPDGRVSDRVFSIRWKCHPQLAASTQGRLVLGYVVARGAMAK